MRTMTIEDRFAVIKSSIYKDERKPTVKMFRTVTIKCKANGSVMAGYMCALNRHGLGDRQAEPTKVIITEREYVGGRCDHP